MREDENRKIEVSNERSEEKEDQGGGSGRDRRRSARAESHCPMGSAAARQLRWGMGCLGKSLETNLMSRPGGVGCPAREREQQTIHRLKTIRLKRRSTKEEHQIVKQRGLGYRSVQCKVWRRRIAG